MSTSYHGPRFYQISIPLSTYGISWAAKHEQTIRLTMFAILHGRYIRNGGICPAYLYCVALRRCGVGSLHAFVQMVATLGTNEIYWMCHISYWNSISNHSITPFWDFVIFVFDPYLSWPDISRKVNNIARCNLLVLIQKWINLFFYFDS